MKKIRLNVLLNKINSKCWWIKNFLFHRYDLIRTGLDKGSWHDTDTVILYGMMNLLVQYVEIEDPTILTREINKETFTCEEERIMAERCAADDEEVKLIYKWWKDYPNREKEIESKYDEYGKCRREKSDIKEECSFVEIVQMEDKLSEEEQDMLIRLIKVRGYLWT
jgi:hypothetical protein